MESRQQPNEFIHRMGHQSMAAPPPHFRRRFSSSESASLSTINIKAPIKRNNSNKRKQEESLSFEDRNNEVPAMFKRQMTSHDEDGDERRDAPSSPPPTSNAESRDQYREISRVGSSELASAVALASLAFGMNKQSKSNSRNAIMRPRQTPITDITRSQSHQQELLMRSISSTSSYGSFGLAMNNLYLHDQMNNRPRFTVPPEAYFNRQPAPVPSMLQQQQPQKWVCDYCNDEAFDSYEEACKHEEKCASNKSAVASDSLKDSVAKGPTTSVESRAIEQTHGNDTGLYFEGVIPLAVPATDHDWLSDTNCFVRSRCIEAFSAQKGEN